MNKKANQEDEEVYTLTPKGLFYVAMGGGKMADDDELDNFIYEVVTYLKRYEMWNGMKGHAAIILVDGELDFGIVGGGKGE
jgi:hypothetical protein